MYNILLPRRCWKVLSCLKPGLGWAASPLLGEALPAAAVLKGTPFGPWKELTGSSSVVMVKLIGDISQNSMHKQPAIWNMSMHAS